MILNRRLLWMVLLLSWWCTRVVAANEVAVADFQTGTDEGWMQPFFDMPGTFVVADAGPAGGGDFALQAIANPGRLRLFPQNTSSAGFIGNFVAAGVDRVQFDALNPTSSDDPLRLFAVVMNDDFNRWVSTESAVIPNDGVWRTFTLSLAEPDVVHPVGGNRFADDFSNVTRFGLRHQEIADQPGGTGLSSANNAVLLDNIRLLAVPEPSAACLASAAIVWMCVSRRRTRAGGVSSASSRSDLLTASRVRL